MIRKYRRTEPTAIEAVQWTGDNVDEILIFTKPTQSVFISMNDRTLKISTSGDNIYAKIGDYVVRKESGEFYSCNPNVFEQRFEPITD